jgi:serine/threonine-protein kinase HipA
LSVEAFVAGGWRSAALVDRLAGAQRDQATSHEYDVDHAATYPGRRGCEAVSMALPVSFELKLLPSFPAYAIDLLPQGEARRRVVARLTATGVEVSDWSVLLAGAGNPVGNLRVTNAPQELTGVSAGVGRDEVVLRGDGYRAWAEGEGIPMAGSSDTAGASPKLLLTEDEAGLLHADGALEDARAKRHYIVKFPRGRTRADARVLANEAPYLEVVRTLGLRCGAALEHHDEGVLFVPRFDRRRVGDRVERLGMESVYSLVQVVQAGARLAFANVCRAIHEAVDDPERDIVELVLRDAASLALGNPDNHGRNTSILKHPDGRIELSPVYDFAPMVLDPDGIRRQTRWRSETPSAEVDYNDVCDELAELVARERLATALRDFAPCLDEASALMADRGVDAELITECEGPLRQVVAALRKVEG